MDENEVNKNTLSLFIFKKHILGPYSKEEIVSKIESLEIQINDLISTDGINWKKIYEEESINFKSTTITSIPKNNSFKADTVLQLTTSSSNGLLLKTSVVLLFCIIGVSSFFINPKYKIASVTAPVNNKLENVSSKEVVVSEPNSKTSPPTNNIPERKLATVEENIKQNKRIESPNNYRPTINNNLQMERRVPSERNIEQIKQIEPIENSFIQHEQVEPMMDSTLFDYYPPPSPEEIDYELGVDFFEDLPEEPIYFP